MRFWPLLALLLFLGYRQYGDRLPDLPTLPDLPDLPTLPDLARFAETRETPVAVPAPATPSGKTGKTGASFVPNYINGPLMQATRRWQEFPIRVFFEKGGAYNSDRRDAALEGFMSWTEASGGVLHYIVVDTASKADVTVRFIPGAYVPPSRSTVGLTRSLSSARWLRSAQMTLATGGRTTLENLTDVAAHEWGHALGINGHSNDAKDLMSTTSVRVITVTPFGRLLDSKSKARTPTRRDVNTMKTIYADRFRS